MAQDEFLTTAELLDYLQVSVQTVHRLIKSGQIPPIRVGREWLFRRADIDGWRDANRRPWGETISPDGTSDRPLILVVDDEATVRDLLAKALKASGYLVDVAEDGTSALARLGEKSYDLLITDLMMPGLDGLSLIREARLTAPALPVIVITGHSSEESAINAINLGVSGYLTKPFRLPRVLAATARALGEPVPVAKV